MGDENREVSLDGDKGMVIKVNRDNDSAPETEDSKRTKSVSAERPQRESRALTPERNGRRSRSPGRSGSRRNRSFSDDDDEPQAKSKRSRSPLRRDNEEEDKVVANENELVEEDDDVVMIDVPEHREAEKDEREDRDGERPREARRDISPRRHEEDAARERETRRESPPRSPLPRRSRSAEIRDDRRSLDREMERERERARDLGPSPHRSPHRSPPPRRSRSQSPRRDRTPHLRSRSPRSPPRAMSPRGSFRGSPRSPPRSPRRSYSRSRSRSRGSSRGRRDRYSRDRFGSDLRVLFLGNLPGDARQHEIRELVEKCSPVDPIRIDRIDIHETNTEVRTTHAYVFLMGDRINNLVMNLNGRDYEGRAVKCELARGDPSLRAGGRTRQKGVPSRTIFVVNFDEVRTTQRDLERLFDKFGKIVRISLRRHFAFVEFEHLDDARRACDEMHKSLVDGRYLLVEYANEDRSGNYDSDWYRRGGGYNRYNNRRSYFGGGRNFGGGGYRNSHNDYRGGGRYGANRYNDRFSYYRRYENRGNGGSSYTNSYSRYGGGGGGGGGYGYGGDSYRRDRFEDRGRGPYGDRYDRPRFDRYDGYRDRRERDRDSRYDYGRR